MDARPIASKADADAYLDTVQRSYVIAGARWSRKLSSWMAQAGEVDRQAMIDLLTEDPPRCEDPLAQARAASVLARLDQDRDGFRARYVARRFQRHGEE